MQKDEEEIMSQRIKLYNIIGFVLSLLFMQPLYADPSLNSFNSMNIPRVLAADEAFEVTLSHKDSMLNVSWKIAPNCYLYRDSIKVYAKKSHENHELLKETSLPSGVIIQDPEQGEQSVYTDSLNVSVDLGELIKQLKQKALIIEVEYQGCAKSGFCYPPINKLYKVTLEKQAIQNISVLGEHEEIQVEEPISSPMPDSYLAAFAAFYALGLLLSFTPCVLPMIPIVFVVVVGQAHLSTRRAFTVSLCYVLSMAITYAIAGVVVATLGKNLQAYMQKPLVLILFASFFVYLGLMQIGIGKISLPSKMRDWLHTSANKQASGSYIGAAAMGILSTLIASPCVSGPMMGALAYISQRNDIYLGAISLFALGLGMGTLLIVIGTLEGKYLPKKGPWMHAINQVFSFILFGMSIWLLDRLLPGSIMLALWGLLLLLGAYWLGTFSLQPNRSGRFGAILVICAAMLFWGSWNGAEDPLDPFCLASQTKSPEAKLMSTIYSLEELDTQKQIAKKFQKPLMVFVHADWCVSCKHFEHEVLALPAIQKKLAAWEQVNVDITKNDKANQLFLQKFDLVGPPVVLFFDSNGKELAEFRVFGEVSEEDFAKKLDNLQVYMRQ
jgi:thiol:disulfide interchange protein DsbD